MHQLPLALSLPKRMQFDTFIQADNPFVVQSLQRLLTTPFTSDRPLVYLWGQSGVGKTHLLQASCWAMQAKGQACAYFSLADPALTPACLVGLEQLTWIVLDDCQVVMGQTDWEEALFHLCNRVLQTGAQLVIATCQSPQQLACQLPDLLSRLRGGLVLFMNPLSDEGKQQALIYQAQQLGLSLSETVSQYLLTHCARDMHSLVAVLNQLDKASLSAQRKLTIPFVKTVLTGQEVHHATL